MGGAVGSGKLLAAKLENSEKHGLDNEALIDAIRKAAFRAADRFDDDPATRDARTEADALLATHLLSCLPSRETLVTLFRTGAPAQSVADHVADALAIHDERFASDAAPVAGFSARSFACTIVREIIEAALANKDYAQKLMVYLGIETLQGVAQANAKLDRLLALAERSTLTDQALRGAIARFIAFQPEASDADVLNAVATFERDYRALLEQVSHIQVHDNHFRSLKNAAEAALDAHDIAIARARYSEAAKTASDKASKHVRNAATLKAAEASAALAMLDWQGADAAWEEAATKLTPFDLVAGEAIVWEAADRLKSFGETFAQTPALIASEQRWRALAAAAAKRGDRKRIAITQVRLGVVLRVQGERTGGEAGRALLSEAVTAYRAALIFLTQADMPAQWAMTQNNLGIALSVQGERTSGEAGLVLLSQAVTAYRAALSVYSQADMRAEWAMTQNNLGIALQVQGERTRHGAGLELLSEAVTAYREALTVHKQADMPAEWAMTQNNLGNVLQLQGARTGGEVGLALLCEAVTAYCKSLTIRTQADMPVDWAMTKENIGLALVAKAELTPGDEGISMLRQAISAFQSALTVYTPEHMPHDYGTAQRNLALAEAALAARLRDGS